MLIVISAPVVAGLPASASASPLLSGYGGPGQGTQAILGASLVNGPGGGGGSPGGGGSHGGPTASAPAGTAASTSAGSTAGQAPAGDSSAPGASSGSRASATGHRTASRRGRAGAAAGVGEARASVLPAGAYPVSERSVAQPSGALGLSTTGLVEALLVLCALAAMVVAMRRLGAAGSPARARGDEQPGVGG